MIKNLISLAVGDLFQTRQAILWKNKRVQAICTPVQIFVRSLAIGDFALYGQVSRKTRVCLQKESFTTFKTKWVVSRAVVESTIWYFLYWVAEIVFQVKIIVANPTCGSVLVDFAVCDKRNWIWDTNSIRNMVTRVALFTFYWGKG